MLRMLKSFVAAILFVGFAGLIAGCDKPIETTQRAGNDSGNHSTSSYWNEPATPQPQRVVELLPPSPKIVVALPEVKLTEEMAKTCKVNVGDFFPIKLERIKNALFTPAGKIAIVVVSSPPTTPRATMRLDEILQDIPSMIINVSGNRAENLAYFFPLVTAETQPLIELVVAREEISSEEVAPRIFLLDVTGKIVWFDCEYSVATRDQLEQALRFLLTQN